MATMYLSQRPGGSLLTSACRQRLPDYKQSGGEPSLEAAGEGGIIFHSVWRNREEFYWWWPAPSSSFAQAVLTFWQQCPYRVQIRRPDVVRA